MPEDRAAKPSIRETTQRGLPLRGSNTILAGRYPPVVPETPDKPLAKRRRLRKPGPLNLELTAGPEDEFIASVIDSGVFGKRPGDLRDYVLHGSSDPTGGLRAPYNTTAGIEAEYIYSASRSDVPFMLGSLSANEHSVLFYIVPVSGRDASGRAIGGAINIALLPKDQAREFVEMVKRMDDGLDIPARFFKKIAQGKDLSVDNNYSAPDRLMVFDQDAIKTINQPSWGVPNPRRRQEIETKATIKTRGGTNA